MKPTILTKIYAFIQFYGKIGNLVDLEDLQPKMCNINMSYKYFPQKRWLHFAHKIRRTLNSLLPQLFLLPPPFDSCMRYPNKITLSGPQIVFIIVVFLVLLKYWYMKHFHSNIFCPRSYKRIFEIVNHSIFGLDSTFFSKIVARHLMEA